MNKECFFKFNRGEIISPHVNHLRKPVGMEIETILKEIEEMKDYDGI